MANPYIGEIRCFGFNFAPVNWALCNGQLMAIQQNPALFSIIGTYYGGNGTSNFALPNLQGQAPMHWGNTAGLPITNIGQVQGSPSVTLTSAQLPSHTHIATAADGDKAQRTAAPTASSFLSSSESPNAVWQSAPTPNTPFSPNAISTVGGSQPHLNMQPFQVLNFCIALYGTFPPRS